MNEKEYEKMEKLQQTKKSHDVAFLGRIHLTVKDPITNENVEINPQIMVSIEDSIQGPIFKFYDETNNLIAINKNDGAGLLPSEQYADILTSKENSESLKILEDFSYEPEKSLNQLSNNIGKVSQTLGISREQIQAMAESKHEQPDDKTKTQNKSSLPEQEKKIMAKEKQQTDLNQKVDEIHTLGDILGIPGGGTLVAVNSTDIENGTTENHTRFSFLIRDKEGNYKECPNLEQIGGVNPSSQVAAAKTYDGSDIDQEQVNSLYRIKGSGNIEYLLTARIGSQGTIELGIGQRDRTQGLSNPQTVTQPLKTTSTLYTTRETREAINSAFDGTYQSHYRNKEAFSHNENCGEIVLDEVDGDFSTGHQHNSDNEHNENIESLDTVITRIASNILEENEDIARVYNFHEVVDRLIKNYHDGISEEELENKIKGELSVEASHIPTCEH